MMKLKEIESVLHILGLGFPRSLVLSCGFEPLSCDARSSPYSWTSPTTWARRELMFVYFFCAGGACIFSITSALNLSTTL